MGVKYVSNLILLISVFSALLLYLPLGAHCLVSRDGVKDNPALIESGYKVPLRGGSGALPQPSVGKHLVQLALARGKVRYSCQHGAKVTPPFYLSQTTTLWDVVPLLPRLTNEEQLHSLVPQLHAFQYDALANSSLTCIGTITTISGQSVVNLFGIEVFTLVVKHQIDAPSSRDPLEIDLDWAYEVDLGGAWEVYRVETVSGQPPANCAEQGGTTEVDYAAEYWFYHN